MIEVERKYRLDSDQEKKLIEDAEFVKTKTNEDIYYDTEDRSLTTSDNWLRSRNGRFELKAHLHEIGRHISGTAYDEIEDEEKIRDFLKLPGSGMLETDLLSSGFMPFVTIIKQRRKYRREDFNIDLDICDFGYQLAEIELMIENESDRGAALERIDALAEQMNLDTSPVRGKIIEYLYRHNKPHYQALVDAGVV
jgi:predicted adenylyl cyclase CyaB